MRKTLVVVFLALVVLYAGCIGGSTTQTKTQGTSAPADDLKPGDVQVRQIGENDTVGIGEMI